MISYLLDILAIIIGVVIADILAGRIVRAAWGRPDIGCDHCQRIVKLRRTPDNKFWLCQKCFGAYKEEISDGT